MFTLLIMQFKFFFLRIRTSSVNLSLIGNLFGIPIKQFNSVINSKKPLLNQNLMKNCQKQHTQKTKTLYIFSYLPIY